MKKENIVVLDHSVGTVTFYKNVKIDTVDLDDDNAIDECELIENWLTENTDHHLSNCSWMSRDEEIEVFEENMEEARYQCGSCEQTFSEPYDGRCPHCGSGNWVDGCIDE